VKISVLTPSIRPKGLEVTRQCLLEQSFTDFEWLVEINWTGKHDLNASYNRMLKRAKGELIVSLQDFIKVTPLYLQKFWDSYQLNPKTFITAPVGKVEYKGNAKWDWRAYEDAKPDWDCWEIDSACAPIEALRAIGGFDEEIDGYWSCDNVNVGKRAKLAGYKFMNLFNNPALAYDHDAFSEHPFRKDFKPIFNDMRMKEFENGLKIDFL
jgi:hypothetical protein